MAIQLTEDALQLVRKVVIVNYVHPTNAARLKNVEVFISATLLTTATTKFDGGALLGKFQGPGKAGEVVQLTSSDGLMGRYVIIQINSNTFKEEQTIVQNSKKSVKICL